MKTFLLGLVGIVVVVGALLAIGWISAYGSLNTSNQAVKQTWSDVQSTLQRRANLIPNLVNTVKGYAEHEEKVFREVTEARSKIGSINVGDALNNPEAMKQFQQAQSEMSGAMSHLIAVAEQYPMLKASENFQICKASWKGPRTASTWPARSTMARCAVTTPGERFLRPVRGQFFGFKPAEYFEAAPESQKVPEVKF